MVILRGGAPALRFAATTSLRSGAPAFADIPSVSVELNKLEPSGGSCRAYLVGKNESTTALKVFKLDLVLFQPDGVTSRRFAVRLAPLRPSERSVKLFVTSCDRMSAFLINDVRNGAAQSRANGDCLAGFATLSLSQAN